MIKLKMPIDINQLGKMIVDLATGNYCEDETPASSNEKRARLGGEERARRLGAQKRREIAKKAAEARWKKDT